MVKNFIQTLFISSLLFVLIIFFKEFYFNLPTNDSSIYTTYGSLISDGKFLYKDMFDNKGPTIFFLNYIGSTLTYKSSVGVLLIELISFLIMTFVTLKIISFSKEHRFLLLSILIISYIFGFYGGNLDTTWFVICAMPIYTFFFFNVTKMKNLTKLQRIQFSSYFGFGFCFIFFLKFNYLSGFFIILLFYLIENKKFIFEILSYFFLGFIAFFSIVYFSIFSGNTNFLSDIFESYFFFNSQYAFQNQYSENNFINLIFNMAANFKDFLYVFYKDPFIILILIVFFRNKLYLNKNFLSKKSYIILLVIIFDGISLILAPVRQASLLFMLPSFFILFSFFIEIEKFKVKSLNLLIFLVILFFLNQQIFEKTHNKSDIQLLSNLKKNSDLHNEYKALALCSFTTGTIWFLKTNLKSQSKYYFTPLLNNRKYLDNIYNNYYKIIKNDQPNYIIINPYCFQKDLLSDHFNLIEDLGYIEIFKDDIKNSLMFQNTKIFYLKSTF